MASEVELAQARVRAASLEAQETEAESELSRFRAQLQSLLMRSVLPPLEGELAALGGDLPEEATFADHPAVKRLEAEARAAGALAEARALDLVPTLSKRVAAKLEYPRALELELGPAVEIGVALAWPIFDGFARERETEAYEARAAALERQAEAEREALSRALLNVLARERTAQARLRSAERAVSENEIYLRVSRAAVAAGTGTELDVLTAELSLDRARVDEKRALFDRALARAEAARVLGRAGLVGGAP